MYAVVRTGGKQYRVEEGRAVKVDHLPGEPGDSVELGDVLLMGEGETVTIGAPTIEGARVVGTIAEQGRDPKIIVFRYKSKTRSRKKTGHRQHFTKIVVDDILAAGQQPKPKVAVAPEEEPPAEAPKKRGRRKASAEEATVAAESEDRVAGLAETETGEAAADDAATEAAAEPATSEAEAPADKPKRTRRKTTE